MSEAGAYDVSFYPNGGQPEPEYYCGYFKLTKQGGGSTEPADSSYYLVGSMNGWTQGDPAYQLYTGTNAGEYVRSNVALEAGTKLKIVNPTTSPDPTWYPGGYNNDYTVEENGLYDVSFYPAGGQTGYYEGFFKLTKVGEYVPDPTEISYYLTGSFVNWTADERYLLTAGENEGEYVLNGVTLNLGAGVKVVSSKNVWFPDGEGNEYIVPNAGIYNVSFYPAGGQTGYYDGWFKLTFVSEIERIPGDDKVILHCWNWTFETIRDQLPAIKAAGYTAVQTSPAQPHSGFVATTRPTGDWWMLYQPLGLHIAQQDESWLGDERDLEALCTAAHALGIEVIVDVVANHLCNGYNDIAADGTDPRSQVVFNDNQGHIGYQFELQPDHRVYEHNPELTLEKFRTQYVLCNDTTTEAVVHGNIGMPDLRTEDATVQGSVLAYLKELIDVGVDGFRFDAAKHIETPSDGNYASDFWPTVINGAEAYAEEEYDKSIWAYGEVLSTAGRDRKMNYYAPYIDMTEISYAYTITDGFGETHSASQIAGQLFKDWLGAVEGEELAASDLVLMAESHDMYAGDHFHDYGPEVINKAWAIAVARADASALYFARPQGYTEADGPVGTLGACDNFNWKDIEVAEANKFHTAFSGTYEDVYAAGSYVVVERYDSSKCGAVIANAVGFAGSISFQTRHLTDGAYYDQITGNEFTVSGGTVSGLIGTTGIAVLSRENPNLCEHPVESQYVVTKPATCTEDGYEAVYCSLCGRQVQVNQIYPALGHIDLNKDDVCDRCGESLKLVTVYFVDSLGWVAKNDYFTNVNVYAFGEGGQNAAWPGVPAELVGRTADEHGIWKAELNPERYQCVKFVGHPGEESVVKTVNLSFAEDAAQLNQDYVLYQLNGATENTENGPELCCEPSADLEAVCAHAAYQVVTVGTGEYKVCDCCGKVFDEVASENPFTDVKEGKYYYKPVLWAYFHDPQITSGTTDTTFSPNQSCTRAQIMTFLWKASGAPEPTITENPFTDVKEGKYYYKAVLWAYENGITSGMNPTTFGVNESCKRKDVVTFLWNAAGKPEPTITNNPFTDVKEGKYYYLPVLWAVEHGITSGMQPDTFGINNTCTRGQIVTFLYAAFKND